MTALTVDQIVTRYQQALDELKSENDDLKLENTRLNTRIACIRKKLEDIEEIAGYPILPIVQRALKL